MADFLPRVHQFLPIKTPHFALTNHQTISSPPSENFLSSMDSTFREEYPFLSSLLYDNPTKPVLENDFTIDGFKLSNYNYSSSSSSSSVSSSSTPKGLFHHLHSVNNFQSNPVNGSSPPFRLNQFSTEGSAKNPLFGLSSTCSSDPFEPYTNGFSSFSNDNLLINPPAAATGYNGGTKVYNLSDSVNSSVLHGLQGKTSLSWDFNLPEIGSKPITGTGQIYSPALGLISGDQGSASGYKVPDEASGIVGVNGYRENANDAEKKEMVTNKKPQVKKAYSPQRNLNITKGQWTLEEDRMLIQLVGRFGTKKWSQIAKMLRGRVGKQCRERWHNHLRPDIKKEEWTEEEDLILINAHQEIGNRWAEMTRRLPGRSENTIKNHWNATKRRQSSSRRSGKNSGKPKHEMLQNYIRTVTASGSSSTYSNTTYNQKIPVVPAGAGGFIGSGTLPNSGYGGWPFTLAPASNENNDQGIDFSYDGGSSMEVNEGSERSSYGYGGYPMVDDGMEIGSGHANGSGSAESVYNASRGMEFDMGARMDEDQVYHQNNWMAMHGGEQEMRKEMDLLEMLSHGKI